MEGDRNMSKLNIVRRCYNCGAILQTDDKEAEGYVSPEVIKTPMLWSFFAIPVTRNNVTISANTN